MGNRIRISEMSLRSIVLLATLWWGGMASALDGVEGGVCVSSNPHWLEFRAKPIMPVGDSVTQGWMECGENFDHRAYLDALAARGLNTVLLWSYAGATAESQREDPRIGYDAPEIWPWEGSPDDRSFDLKNFNFAYFERLRAFVDHADSKDIIVVYTVHDGWPKTRFAQHPFNASLGNGPLTDRRQFVELADYDTEMAGEFDPNWTRQQRNQYFQERFSARVVEALGDCPNIVFEMFNEGEWYDREQRREHEEHFLRFFRKRTSAPLMTNLDHIKSRDYRPRQNPDVDIISMHGKPWTGHFEKFATQFHAEPARVVFESEPVPSFGGADPGDGDVVTPDELRAAVWERTLSGSGWVAQNDASFAWDPRTGMASQAALRDQAYDFAGITARFFNQGQVAFWSMHPDAKLASTEVCLANPGIEYVVYAPQGGEFTVDVSAANGAMSVTWVNPRTGDTAQGQAIGGGTVLPFTPPFQGDAVLHLKQADHTASAFVNITASAGTAGPTKPPETGGHGAMFADVDDDGLPDLYITMIFDIPMAELFYRNLGGGKFAEEGRKRGIADFDGGSHGACFADLDNDGDYDLFNGTTWDHPEYPCVNNIFRNEGDATFTDVTVECSLPQDRRWPTRGVLTLDIDGDGDLDLFGVTNYQGSADPPDELNELYRNKGGLRFTPVQGGDLAAAPCGQGATDTDFDFDGDIDILVGNRTGPVNILRNDGRGDFTLVPPESLGIEHQGKDGVTAADVDNDGDLDLMLAGDQEGFLYLRGPDGKYSLAQAFAQTDGYMGGFADLDNDGDLDLVFAGDDIIYLNDGTGRFTPGPAVPLGDSNDPRGIAFADIDLDGDLDFAIACKRSGNQLIRNDLAGGNWLKVRLVSPQGQAGAFGAKTYVYAAGDGERRLLGMRESRSNNGYLGQNDPLLHFGLGREREVSVKVEFLDGTTKTVSEVAAGQTIVIDGRR